MYRFFEIPYPFPDEMSALTTFDTNLSKYDIIWVCTFSGVDVSYNYSHARWKLSEANRVSLVVSLVNRVPLVNRYWFLLLILLEHSGTHPVSGCRVSTHSVPRRTKRMTEPELNELSEEVLQEVIITSGRETIDAVHCSTCTDEESQKEAPSLYVSVSIYTNICSTLTVPLCAGQRYVFSGPLYWEQTPLQSQTCRILLHPLSGVIHPSA